jgi:ribokinase
MSPAARPRVAVVGHSEWVTHGLGVMPLPGEITRLSDPFEEPAGGGGVSAAQVSKLGADCLFFTAVGEDAAGDAVSARLQAEGVTVLAAVRAAPQTRAISAVAAGADRAIVVIGEPTSPLIASASDATEAVDPAQLPVPPGVVLWTEGGAGGRFRLAGGRQGRWDPAPLPGPVVDSYGCGDSFAAGLTAGLARGLGLEAALVLAARCGAACLTGRGGLAPQLVEVGVA